jgi:hypothetical protein
VGKLHALPFILCYEFIAVYVDLPLGQRMLQIKIFDLFTQQFKTSDGNPIQFIDISRKLI